jgi:hypothetical protein
MNIVVSRYKKNTDFIYKLEKYGVNILIYDKETPSNPYNVPINRGNEASAYLKYIVDHYDNLPEYTLFLHDEEYSWHHNGSIEERFLEAVNSNELYYNINNFYLKPTDVEQNRKFYRWYKKYIQPYIPLRTLPKNWMEGHKGCAQFLVHKSLIQHLPKKFYQNLYNWILNFKDGKLSGYYLEWTWHLFWDVSPNIYTPPRNRFISFFIDRFA